MKVLRVCQGLHELEIRLRARSSRHTTRAHVSVLHRYALRARGSAVRLTRKRSSSVLLVAMRDLRCGRAASTKAEPVYSYFIFIRMYVLHL